MGKNAEIYIEEEFIKKFRGTTMKMFTRFRNGSDFVFVYTMKDKLVIEYEEMLSEIVLYYIY